ncbi:MAG: alginate lyase family protein [Clostridia bacterium]|nr:alginate lyase family protein [Clostridia bacterium]
MKFIFAEDYSIYPPGMPLCYPGNSWRGQICKGKDSSLTVEACKDGRHILRIKSGACAGVYTWFKNDASVYIFETEMCLPNENTAAHIYIDIKDNSEKPPVAKIDKNTVRQGYTALVSLKINLRSNIASVYINREFLKTVSLDIKSREEHDRTDVVFIKLLLSGKGELDVFNTVIYDGNEFCTQEEKESAFKRLNPKLHLSGDFGYSADMSDKRVKALSEALTKHTDELPLFVNDAELESVKKKIKLNKYPFQRAWEGVTEDANSALTKEYPMILLGQAQPYMAYGISAAAALRDLSFYHRITGDEKYAKKALEILMKWASAKAPIPIHISLGSDVNGLTISRVMVTFAFGYSLLYRYISDSDRRVIEKWFTVMACAIKRSLGFWVSNDCYDKQYYQNHIAVMVMGLAVLGAATKNVDILTYALYADDNKYNYERLLTGTIIGYKDTEIYYKDPCFTAGKPYPKPGEIYDRYRARVGKGIHYSMLSARCLLYVAEVMRHYGIDYYSYTGEHGENLKMPFEFYSDFYLYRDNSLKGGYYGTSLIHNHECFIFSIAAAAYPESKILKNFCLRAPIAQRDTEQFGYLASLIFTPVYDEQECEDLPRLDTVTINNERIINFSRGRFYYNIKQCKNPVFEVNGTVELCTEVKKADNGEYALRVWEMKEPMHFATYRFRPIADLEKRDNIQIVSECSYKGKNTREIWCVMDLGEDTKVCYITFYAECDIEEINVSAQVSPFENDIWKNVSSELTKHGVLFKIEIPKEACRFVKLIFTGTGKDKVMLDTIRCYNIRQEV